MPFVEIAAGDIHRTGSVPADLVGPVSGDVGRGRSAVLGAHDAAGRSQRVHPAADELMALIDGADRSGSHDA